MLNVYKANGYWASLLQTEGRWVFGGMYYSDGNIKYAGDISGGKINHV